jgi:hypothetical protein
MVKSMRKISFFNIAALLLILLSASGIIISQIFTPDFVAKNFGHNGRIGEHVIVRVSIFQTQMFYIAVTLGALGAILLIFRKWIKCLIQRKKTLFLNIAMVLVICVLFFAIGEVILRVFFSGMIISEYGNGPGALQLMNSAHYNSFGYRDVEHTIAKPQGVYRIVVIGDSFTFGNGIKNPEDIYSRLLQKKLDIVSPGKYEVITLGTGGYSTLDEYNVLNNLALNLSPDLIILGYYANDAEGLNSRVGYEKMFFQHYLIPWEAGAILYTHSYMYYFMESRLMNIAGKFGHELTYIDYLNHLYSDSNPFFPEHRKYLSGFINISNAHKVPVAVLNFPAFSDSKEYPFQYISDYVKNISLSNNASFIDMETYFSAYNADALRVSFLDGHMNELGHNITANVLFEYIKVKNNGKQ